MKYITLALLFVGYSVGAQVVEEAPIKELLDFYFEEWDARSKCTLWQVQLIATTERRKAERIYHQLRQMDGDGEMHIVAPYYYVRAGRYWTREEALHALKRYRLQFPRAHVLFKKVRCERLIERTAGGP